MKGDPERLREWAAHWASKGHGPDSGLLLLREIWDVGDKQTERWELRLADLTATLTRLDEAEAVVARIQPDRLHPWHTLHIFETTWSLVHPIDCPLADCQFTAAAMLFEGDPSTPGAYRWDDPFTEPVPTG